MTIEEAIQHCRDHARKQKAKADKYTKNYLMYAAKDCEECAAEHEQLAEWLTELKQRRDAEIMEMEGENVQNENIAVVQ